MLPFELSVRSPLPSTYFQLWPFFIESIGITAFQESELTELKSLRVQCLEETGRLEQRLREDAEAIAGLKQQVEALNRDKGEAYVLQRVLIWLSG